MAGHLADKLPSDSRIYVFDVVEEEIEKLAEQFLEKVNKISAAKEVAEKADIIISMVPEGSHVRSVYLDQKAGVCRTNISNKLIIDCSALDTDTSLTVKDQITTLSPITSFYDAPVSGGVVGAIKGTIAFFPGCSPTDPNQPKIRDTLKYMGKDIIPRGGPSLGLAAKLSNNYLNGIIAIAVLKLSPWAWRPVSPLVLARVFATGTAQNKICDKFCPVPGVYEDSPSSKGYREGFKVQLMSKDFGLAVEMAERCRDLNSRVVFRYLGGDEGWMDKVKQEEQEM
ncbi:NAD binding domain of 6-phosphogluconate dehydrogenase-domain-containing protein [Halenospora varia]|nr:NAD binding domain of 6-phosphogluconate dehydrogenase-domain-containing protein [Halenospora varia]